MTDRMMYVDKEGDVVPEYMDDALIETVTLDEEGNEIDPIEAEKKIKPLKKEVK